MARPDGDIDDQFFGYKKDFNAHPDNKVLKDWIVDRATNARWRASPFWPVSFPYLILHVDFRYQYALIGYPDKSLGEAGIAFSSVKGLLRSRE